MFGSVFGPTGAGEILKTVFKTSGVGVVSGAVSDLSKSTGAMGEIGKLLDGLVTKPNTGGLAGGIGKSMQKILDQLSREKGIPTGLMPMDFFDGKGGAGGKSVSPSPGGAGGGAGGGLAGMAQRAMFIAALQQAIQKAASQQNFNMETAINDLWVKLSGLRPQGNQNIQQLNQMFGMLEGMIKQMHDMQKGVIQNMR
jgi:hypothetical protein